MGTSFFVLTKNCDKKNYKKNTHGGKMALSRTGHDSETPEPVTSNVRVQPRQIRCAIRTGENVLTVMFSPLSLRLYESEILRMFVSRNHPVSR